MKLMLKYQLSEQKEKGKCLWCKLCSYRYKCFHFCFAFKTSFKFYKCGAVAVDGGHDYLRRCGNREDWEELSEIEEWFLLETKLAVMLAFLLSLPG